jgi:hypothetical protein
MIGMSAIWVSVDVGWRLMEPRRSGADEQLGSLMEAYPENKMHEIKQEIQQGKYRVDAQAVADAILRRLQELMEARAQPECGTGRRQ